MTTITIDRSLLEQALEVIVANTTGKDALESAIRAELAKPVDIADEMSALAAQPSNYSDWQQRRGVLADIVDEALASYEAWMAEDDYNATDALHKIMDHMRQRAASYAKPAQQPAPAWHDAPTCEGLWVCRQHITDHVTAYDVTDHLKLNRNLGLKGRWYGPIPLKDAK